MVELARGSRLDHVHRHRYWLAHGDVPARVEAAMSLGLDAGEAALAVPALIASLDDPSLRVVGEAVAALGLLGTSARNAAPRFAEFARRADGQIAARARASTQRVGGR